MTGSTMKSTLSLSVMALSLAACSAFGPDRNPPDMAMPAHYAADATDQVAQDKLSSADGVAQRLNHQYTPVPAWWALYQSNRLNTLVEEGLANNQNLAAAQHNLQAAREQLRGQIGSNLFPTVDVGLGPTRQRALGIPGQNPQTVIENIFAAQVQTSYTFDFFGAALLADRALAGQVQQQAFQLEATRRSIASNIVTAVINAASLQAQLDATTQLVTLGEQRAAQMRDRYQLGSVSHDDMLAAEQDAANAAATLPGLRAQTLAVRHALAVLLGRTPDQAPEAIPLDELHLPAEVPVSVPTDLLHQRPDILAAESAVRLTADEAAAATAAMFPSLTLSASYGRGGFDWSTFKSPAGVIWSVGASLTQPIFHGGALVARKHQYEALHEVAVAQYKQTVLSAFQNVADTLVQLDEDANTLTQTQRAATAAQASASDSTSRYQLGALPFYATLTAGQQYQNALVQIARAKAARLADTAALYDAMGNPPVDALGSPLRREAAAR